MKQNNSFIITEKYLGYIYSQLTHNNMNYRVENFTEKKLVGKRISMSFSQNKTGELWSSFMSGRKEIVDQIGTACYSMQVYPSVFFESFNPNAEFEKWAAVEVADFKQAPADMETFNLSGGLYAVFLYLGDGTDADGVFKYIFETWLPASEYILDHRPHFEILGEKYKRGDQDSEEEIWIPVRSI